MADNFKRYINSFEVDSNKKVESVVFNLVGSDFEGDITVTDLQLQAGTQTTAHNPHTSEFLEQVKFTVDENDFLNTVANPVKEGVQPKVYENINNRLFNLVGRGSEVIALPNVLPEDFTQDLVSSALDLTLIAKDDFDLVRISTDYGSLMPDRKYNSREYPPLAEHPLNHAYTREFYFGRGVAGDEIKLKASEFTASLNDKQLPLQQGTVTIDGHGGHTFKGIKQQFMMSPYGTFRIRIEFYEQVTEMLYWTDDYGEQSKQATYLKDTGVGFYGYAEFNQYKERSKY